MIPLGPAEVASQLDKPTRALSLRGRLILVVVACVLPLCAFSLGMQYVSYRDAHQAAEQRTLEMARSLALALERELQARIALLQVLALSRRLQEDDFTGFRSQAEALIAQQLYPGATILLIREDGQEVMNTALPPEAPLPSRRNLDTVRRVFETARPSVSGVFAGTADGRPVIAIEVPVLNLAGQVAYVLALNPPFSVFADIIRLQQPSKDWVAVLLDAKGLVIARVPDGFTGQSASPGFLARLLAEQEGTVETISLEGTPVLSAFSHTASFGWSAGVAVPTAMLTAQPRRAALGTLVVGLTLLILGLFAAGAMARRITGPIAALRRLAAAAEAEPAVEPLANTLPETAEVAAALSAAARERHLALEVGAVGIFNWNLRTGHLRWDERMRAIWVVPKGVPPDAATFYAGIHADDRQRITDLFETARSPDGSGIIAAEYRVVGLADGVSRTVATRAKVTFDDGRPARMLGTVVDITERRVTEERQTLLAREVDHRAKNVLAVVQSIVRMAPRNVPPADFAATVEGRITAMARAHSLLAAAHWVSADLRAIVEGELAVHITNIRLDGQAVSLSPIATQPMGMLLHELTTNAAKHGALAMPQGVVGVSWMFQPDGMLVMHWDETGGPPIAAAPTRLGFGSRLILSLAERQLSGKLQRHWRPTGLLLTLTLPTEHAQPTPGTLGIPWTETHRQSSFPRPASIQDPSAAGGRVTRVLVVEDEALLAMELEQSLRSLGYEVIGPARSLAEAVRLAAAQPRPDVAVLDVNLAGEMVFPAADILTTRGVPVLFATGYNSAPTFAGFDVKAAAILRKPYQTQLLRDALARACQPPAADGH